MTLPPRAEAVLRPLGRFFLVAGLALVAAGCGEGEEGPAPEADVAAGMDAVREGMTMEQVLELWGTPNVRVRDEDGERWSYWFRDDRQRVVGKAYVWFDLRRRVNEVRRTPEQRPGRDAKPPPITVTLGPRPGAFTEGST